MIRLAGLLLAALSAPLAAQAQHLGVPLVSTSALGVVSATYGYFQFISATSSNIVATDSTKVAKAGDTMTGNLGISASLEIQNAGFLQWRNGSAAYSHGTAGSRLGLWSDNNFYFDNYSGPLIFRGPSYAELMRINSDGDVGIGTTPGTPRLYVYRNDANTSVYGYNASSGIGVRGYSASGVGGHFQSAGANYGVYGESANNYGVYGKSTSSTYGGVLGYTANGAIYGILGHANTYSLLGNGPIYSSSYVQAVSGVYTNQVCDVNGANCVAQSALGGSVPSGTWCGHRAIVCSSGTPTYQSPNVACNGTTLTTTCSSTFNGYNWEYWPNGANNCPSGYTASSPVTRYGGYLIACIKS